VDTGEGKARKAKGELLNVGQQCWSTGHFSPEETQHLFEAMARINGRPGRDEDAEIVLFPRVDLLKSQGGRRNTFKRKVFIPLVVFAQVDLAQKHVGQMTGEFPLSPKQRIAMHHLDDLRETVGSIRDGLNKANRFKKVRLQIIDKFKSIQRMVKVYAEYRNQFNAIKRENETYRTQLDRLYESWRQRPWWAKIVFIKWIITSSQKN
jgi:hypothetical protein